MISWIQRSFQHHFKYIFALILGATIISFVVTIGAQGGIGKADHTVATRDFFGHNLGSPSVPTADYMQIVNNARLSAELQIGSGIDDEQLSSYALQRVAALHFADELHLPAATPTEMEGFIRNLRIFADDKGQFDPAKYATFRENLSRAGITEATVAQVLAEDIRIDRVQHLLDGPGYVLPDDVHDQLVHMDTTWTVGLATVDYASFHPAIQPTDDALAKFYAENALRYQIPAQLVAGYVDFPSAPHLAGVTVTDAQVRAFYDADPSRFPSKTKAPPAAAGAKAPALPPQESPDAAFASVKSDVAATLRLERARRAALKDASDFAYGLYQDKVAAGAPFDAYLAGHGLALKPLAPFAQDAGPAELGNLTDIGSVAFKLDADHYFSEAVPTTSGGAVLVWKGLQPSRKPALAEVRAKVAADYYEEQRRQQFVALGQALKAQLQKQVKAGDDFAKAAGAAAAGLGVKVETKVLPAFTLVKPPTGLDDNVAAGMEHLQKGTVSDMVAAADKGYLVYAIDRKEPDPKTDAARVAADPRPAGGLFGPQRLERLPHRDGAGRAQAHRAGRREGAVESTQLSGVPARLPPKFSNFLPFSVLFWNSLMPRIFAPSHAAILSLAALSAVRAQDAAPAPAANPAYAAPVAPAPIVTDATPAQSGLPLTLEECVAQALAKNFAVQISNFGIDNAKQGVIIAQSTYDPTLGVTWQKQVVQQPTITNLTNTVGKGAKPTTDDQSTSATLTQNVITGGTVTAGYDLGRNATNSLQSLFNPAYDGTASINVTQPLLQGAGTAYARALVQIQKLNVSIANENFKSTVLTTILNVETAYYNLVYARRNFLVGQDNVKLAQTLLDENTTKRQTGTLTDLDVVTAQSGLATAQSQLITDRQAVENAEDTLFAAMGEREFKNAVGVVDFPALPSTDVSFFVSYKLARDSGPNLAIAQFMIQQLKLDALRAQKANLPQLNVNGGAAWTDIEHSYGSASNNLWPGPGYNWNAGASLSIPLGMRATHAALRQARDNMNSEQVTYDQTDQQLIVQVRADVRAVTADVENVAATGQAEVLSQKQYDLQ